MEDLDPCAQTRLPLHRESSSSLSQASEVTAHVCSSALFPRTGLCPDGGTVLSGVLGVHWAGPATSGALECTRRENGLGRAEFLLHLRTDVPGRG